MCLNKSVLLKVADVKFMYVFFTIFSKIHPCML